jgi:hypothetical protein
MNDNRGAKTKQKSVLAKQLIKENLSKEISLPLNRSQSRYYSPIFRTLPLNLPKFPPKYEMSP